MYQQSITFKNPRHNLKRNSYNKYYNFKVIDVVEITLSF